MSKDLLACYLRLSKEDEREGESGSIRNQRELLKAFVENSPELSQYEVIEFCDDGYSGTNLDRPGIKALLEEVRTGDIRCVVVKDFSRFGRNYIDIGDYLEQIFPFLGVRFISVNDRFDSSDFEGRGGGLEVGFRNLFYSLYSQDLSQKVRSARKTRMEKGEFIGSFAPYGYAKAPENRRQLVIDEEAAAVVRRIFQMAAEGKHAVSIAAALNSEDIPTPYVYKRLKGCGRKFNVIGERNYWHNTTILRIIRDARYTGKMVSGKSRSPAVGSRHSKRVPESEWIIVSDTHKAIVSEELFDSVQKHLPASEKRKMEPSDGKPLLGKVKCGNCRHAMKRSSHIAAAAYYYCESHQYVPGSRCTKDRILENSLTQTVLSVIQAQMAVMFDMESIIKRVNMQGHDDRTVLTDQIGQLQAVCSRLVASRIQMYERYRDGILDRESYIKQKTDIGRQIAKTDIQIEELKAVLQRSYLQNGQSCFDREGFKGYDRFAELSKEMIDELIDSIYVYGKEEIEIVWNHKDEYTEFAGRATKTV